jgi:signal transduction histidine kinase
VDDRLRGAFLIEVANLLTASVPAILEEFEQTLRSVGSQLLDDEFTRAQVLAHCRELVEKTAQEIHGQLEPEIHYSLAYEIGATRAITGLHPNESLRASDALFRAVVMCFSRRASGERASEQITTVALTLHNVMARALRIAAESYVGVLLSRVHLAQVEERRRISRELHDHIGNGIGVAQRDLELFDIYRQSDPERALRRIASARRNLVETMEAVRLTIHELRLSEPMEGLEKSIKLFLETSADPGLNRHVEVNGDETWASPQALEEVFLIIREALRNTIAHAGAQRVRIRVDITPDELHALVVDDGQGFDTAAGSRGGAGLLSMRERAALLGGAFMLSSAPGRGTRIDLRVPLRGSTP